MQKIFMSALLVASAFGGLSACTRNENSSSSQFIGGFLTGGKKDFPAAVRLDFPAKSGRSGGSICSGTKVSPFVYLTAAHCLLFVRDKVALLKKLEDKLSTEMSAASGDDPGRKQMVEEIADLKRAIDSNNAMSVVPGSTLGITAAKSQSETLNGSNPDYRVKVVDFWFPQAWDGLDLTNKDIALIKVDKDLSNIGTARFSPVQSFEKLPVFKTGYGCETPGGGVTKIQFKFAPSYVLPRAELEASLQKAYPTSSATELLAGMEGMIFASPKPLGVIDAAQCPGDSGSALYVPDSLSLSSSLVLGVVSGHFYSDGGKKIVADFSTSVYEHISAIEAFIAKPSPMNRTADSSQDP
jgi:hypothetical protein